MRTHSEIDVPESIYYCKDTGQWYDSQQICRIFTFFYVKEYFYSIEYIHMGSLFKIEKSDLWK